MKFFSFFILFLACLPALADNSASNQNLELSKEKIKSLEEQVTTLESQLNKMAQLHATLNTNIEKSLDKQQEIQTNAAQLLNTANLVASEQPSLKVHLLQPTNLYIFALPIVTICIVLGGTYLSLRTLKIKSQESLDALRDSNENQLRICEINNDSEHKKSQDGIISNNRQEWINTLRNEISSLLSHQTQYCASSSVKKAEIFSKIWQELVRIELLLNPQEDLHKQLVHELNVGFSLCTSTEKTDEYRKQRAVVIDVAQKILKSEWNRVKSFD